MGLGRVADSSWLYAIFDGDDAWHHDAERLVQEPRPTLVPAPIMVETLDLIRYRLGKSAAREAERAMERFPHFDTWYPVSERDVVGVWKEHDALSLHDAAAVALARSSGFDLVTFDRAQAEAVHAMPHADP